MNGKNIGNPKFQQKVYLDRKISNWKGCCHHCGRGTSVAGPIGDDGLCEFCRRNGRVATW
jgi:hypothetical protein